MKLEKFKEKDKKKVGVIVFTIVCVLLISGVILYRTFAMFEVKTNQNIIKGSVEGMGDLEFAFYINDTIVKDAPSKENKTSYVFDEENSNCTNDAHVYWDYQQWGPMVTDITKTKTKCYLKFKTEYSEDILNGAVPKLKEELTPVILEEDGTVKRADTTTSWYKYGEQKWANAVITKNSFDVLGSNVHGATKEEGYVHFDGVDDYIDLGLANYDFKNQVTIAVNIKLNSGNKYQTILGNQESSGLGIELTEDNQLRGFIHRDSYHYATYIPKNGESIFQSYYCVIFIYNGSNLKLYINSEEVDNQVYSGNITKSTMSMFLGAKPSGSFANIDVKQAAIFDRAIDEKEIQEISNNFKITNGSGLLKYVDFTKDSWEVGEIIPEESIESYFVWIPRYKYQIWNGEEETSQFTSVQSLGEVNDVTTQDKLNQAKEIKIEFENKHMPVSNGNLKNQWLTHPAFTSFESDGFWVGKFETGYKGATSAAEAQNIENTNKVDTSKVIIKPNVYSWRNVNVSNAFYTSKGYKTNLDSHMIKNMEWGAVAYLTNSQYGRCPGGSCTEVRINNSSSFVTGASAIMNPTCKSTSTGTDSDCNQYGESTPGLDNTKTINYKNKQSVISSTTNSYYGVYDMSGGAWEYVMGVMADENGNLNFEQMGFASKPELKYYDSYVYGTLNQDYTRGRLGDGTKEFGPFYLLRYSDTNKLVSSWNADNAYFTYSNYRWFLRGAPFAEGFEAGINNFHYDNGGPREMHTFRIILTP